MLILASKSPRRREILAAAGIPFEVRAADVPEIYRLGESPSEFVCRLAAEKAAAVERHAHETVLAADTIVVAAGETIFGKPRDAEDAALMLAALSGGEHAVITGICIVSPSQTIVDVEITQVFFAPLSRTEIDLYVASGEPMDKAGAYAIQGLASKFIERIEGDYFNVVGLPVARVYRWLNKLASNKQ